MPPNPLQPCGEQSGPVPFDPKLKNAAGGTANGHRNETQRKLLDALESSYEEEVNGTRVVSKVGRGAGKPVRHSLHRTPTQVQQACWEEVQQAKRQGLSLWAIARKLDISRVVARKYALAESPPTKLFSAKERAKAEALAASLTAAD